MATSVSGTGGSQTRIPNETVMTRRTGALTRAAVDENVLTVRDRVQWGPILAGAIVGLMVLLVMTLLGLGIGASAFDPDTELSDWDSWAGIWGGISILVAFLIGGWLAARSAAVEGSFAGLMNGLLAGATMVAALILFTSLGLTNLLGFFGGNLATVSDYAHDVAQGTATPADRQAAFDAVKDGAWGTLVTLVLALAAAALAGAYGSHHRQELIEGTGLEQD